MTSSKIFGALGLCHRAGKITIGVVPVKEALHQGKAALVLLASDTAKNSTSRLVPLAEHLQVPVKRIPLTKKELGLLLGKKGEAVCASVPTEFVTLVLASL